MFINNQKYSKVLINSIISSIVYLICFTLISFDNVYYIIKKEGNNVNKYFQYGKRNRNNESSVALGHDIKEDKCNEYKIRNYINFYKYCSKIFEFNRGKVKYIGKSSKFDLFDDI